MPLNRMLVLFGFAATSTAVLAAGSHVDTPYCAEPVWQDEFSGNSLDEKKWNVIEGDGCAQDLCGWGNNELQWYSRNNVSVKDGLLVITAQRENPGNKDENSAPLTSAKITTQGLFTKQYGRFEARMKLPQGLGTWPAFWLMPDAMDYRWPIEGEIDILERGGKISDDLNRILGAIHFGKPYPDNVHYSESLLVPQPWHKNFHTYAVEWQAGKISWLVDGRVYGEVTPELITPYKWPFASEPFYIILNLALGGNLGGSLPDDFQSDHLAIDYVRVYTANCDADQ